MNGIEMYAKLTGKSLEESRAIAEAAAKAKAEEMKNAHYFLYEGETLVGAFRTLEEAEREKKRALAGALSECAYMHNEGVKAAVVANFTIKEK